MSWFCSVCEKSFSRKDSMQRHVMSKHRNAGLTPFQTVPMFSQKCQRFRFEHPFTSMIAGMTGSGKTAWVRFLLQQASETTYNPPERIVWCYSQWQPAYTQMLVAMQHIEFVEGIPLYTMYHKATHYIKPTWRRSLDAGSLSQLSFLIPSLVTQTINYMSSCHLVTIVNPI